MSQLRLSTDIALCMPHRRLRIWIGFFPQWRATMYGNPPLWPNIPSGEEGGGWSEWSGRFPNASRNEESEDQNIEENVARNAFLLI